MKNNKLYLNIFKCFFLCNTLMLLFFLKDIMSYDYSLIVALDVSPLNFIIILNAILLLRYIYKYITQHKNNNKILEKLIPEYLVRLYLICVVSIIIFPITIYFSEYPFGDKYINLGWILNPLSFLYYTDTPIINIFENLLGNIVIFVPLGIYIKYYKKWSILKTLVLGAMLSGGVEVIQRILSRYLPEIYFFNKFTIYANRLSDFGDITLNVLGVLIGYLLCKILPIHVSNKKYAEVE